MDSLLLRGGEEPQICINLDCYFSYWLVTVEKFYARGTAFQFSVWTCHAESKSGKNGALMAKLDRESVRTARTQPGSVGKFSVF